MKQNMNGSDWMPKGFLIYAVILALIGVGSWISFIRSDNFRKKRKVSIKKTIIIKKENIDESSKIGAQVSAENYVKLMMKEPGMTEFSSRPIITERKIDGFTEYIVDSYVDAGSEYGVTFRQNFICVLRYAGNYKYELVDMKFY